LEIRENILICGRRKGKKKLLKISIKLDIGKSFIVLFNKFKINRLHGLLMHLIKIQNA